MQPLGVDNVNVPAPVIDENHVATTPAALTLRQEFLEFTGTYVIHCHRLNHEDNGLMALINVIPEVLDVRGRDTRAATAGPRPSRCGTPTATRCCRPSSRSPTSRACPAWPWPTSTAT